MTKAFCKKLGLALFLQSLVIVANAQCSLNLMVTDSQIVCGEQTRLLLSAGWESAGGNFARYTFEGSIASKNIVFLGGDTGSVFKSTDGGINFSLLPFPKKNTRIRGMKFITETKGFLVTDSAEIYMTLNGGNSWTKKNFAFTLDSTLSFSFSSFSDIEFTDTLIGFAGGGRFQGGGNQKAYLLKTTDGGNTWQQLVLGLPNEPKPIRDIHFLTSLIGFIACDGGLYKTTDGGNTWTVSHSFPSLYYYKLSFLNKDTGFVMSNGLMRTYDQGETWTVLSGAAGLMAYGISIDESGSLYQYGNSAQTGVGIYKSTNLGNTWLPELLPTTITNNYSIQSILFGKGNAGVLTGITMAGNGFVLKNSEIDSVTWLPADGLSNTHTKNPIASPTSSTTYFVTAKLGTCLAMANVSILVEPLNVSMPKSYLGSCGDSIQLLPKLNTPNNQLYTFLWQPSLLLSNSNIKDPIATAQRNIHYNLIVSHPTGCIDTANTSIVLDFSIKTPPAFSLKCGDEKSILVEENTWINFEPNLLPMPETDIKEVVWAGGDTLFMSSGKIIWRSINKGRNWSPVFQGDVFLGKGYFRNANLGYFTAFNPGPMNGVILKTSNGGNTWQTYSVGGNYLITGIYFTSDNAGYLTCNPQKILKTTNGGITWLPFNTGTTTSLSDIFFTSDNVGFAIGSGGTITKTTNAGINWSAMSINPQLNFNKIVFTTPTKGFIGGNASFLYKTTNGGNTWDTVYLQQNSNQFIEVSDIHFVDSLKGYLTTTQTQIVPSITKYFIYETLDGGISWKKMVSDSSIKISQLFIHKNSWGISSGGPGQMLIKSMKPDNYNWFPATGLSNPNTLNPLAKPLTKTTYTLTAFKDNCMVKDSVTINVSPFIVPSKKEVNITCGDSLKLGRPNVFISIDASRQGLCSWEIKNAQNQIVMLSKPDSIIQGNFEFVPGSYTLTLYPKVIPPPLSIRIIPYVGDSLSESILYSFLDTLQLQFSVGSTQTYNYTWAPNIQRIGPSDSITPITLLVNDNKGCIANDTITLKPLNLQLYIGRDQQLICGETLALDTVATNSKNYAQLQYSWLPQASVNYLPGSKAYISPNTSGYIIGTAQSSNGCLAKDSAFAEVAKLGVLAVDTLATCLEKFKANVKLNTSKTFPISWQWQPNIGLDSSTIQQPVITPSQSMVYTVSASTWNGCLASDTLNIQLTNGKAPNICIVGVNEQNKNQIIWSKKEGINASKFLLYKEGNTTNQYQKIAEVLSTEIYIYTDSNSNPFVQANKYKLERQDVCGINSQMSQPHKTMHLTINKGTANTWNLIWNSYEGFVVSSYKIYRGTDSTNLVEIGITSGSNNAYTDLNAPGGLVYYQVELISPESCDPGKQYNSSRSNIISSAMVGQTSNAPAAINYQIYPNPTSGKVWFEPKPTSTNVRVYNTQGIVLMNIEEQTSSNEINLSELPNGIYYLVFETNSGSYAYKVVKQ